MAEIMEQLAHRVYKLDYPPRKRTRPMEVLAVGISRSGTESLRQAIEILGVSPTFHGFDAMLPPSILQEFYRLVDKKWCKPAGPNAATGSLKLTREDFDHLWGNHVAVTDLPAATFARELIHAYPEAKVILNHRRDVEDWHRSYMQTLEQMPGLNYDSAWLKSWFW